MRTYTILSLNAKYFDSTNDINPFFFFIAALQRGTNSKCLSLSYKLQPYLQKRFYADHIRLGSPYRILTPQDLLQALTIDSSSAIKVKGLTIQNAQQMHFIIARSDSVRVSGVQVSAPGDSPNTDGIHITESTNVVLENCKIGTGSYFILFFFLR